MLTRLLSRPQQPRRVRIINAISMTLVFLTLFMYTNPIFMQPSDADWKEPVIVVGAGIAAGVTIYAAIATAPLWLTITGAVAGGIAAGTAIWEWVDDDCDDCDGSGCDKCLPPAIGYLCSVCDTVYSQSELSEHQPGFWGFCRHKFARCQEDKHEWGGFPCGDDTHRGWICKTPTEHEMQASCTVVETMYDNCTVTSFYPCKLHTHQFLCSDNYVFGHPGCGEQYEKSDTAAHKIEWCTYCKFYYKACTDSTCNGSSCGHSFQLETSF